MTVLLRASDRLNSMGRRQRESPRSTDGRSRRFDLALLAGALVMLLLAPITPIFVPIKANFTRVDVILVLGPAEESRLNLAKDLLSEGFADSLVISASEGSWRLGQDNIGLCHQQAYVDVTCLRPSPFTTQGEIAALEQLSVERGWDSALIITSTPHVNRTRLYVSRCYSGEARVISDNATLSPNELVYHYVYQSAAFVKALFVTPDCG